MEKLCETYNQVLNEYFEDEFKKFIPKIERMFNIKIIKTLGESSGVAYLTSENKVLKITSSNGEINISKKLKNNPSKYFPIIYNIRKITENGWFVILKEFIPEPNDKLKKLFNELEKNMDDWIEDEYDLFSHKIIDTKDTTFIEFLNDMEPHLVNIYKDLVNIQNFAGKWVDDIIDIHEDNIGWNGNNIVLFDY